MNSNLTSDLKTLSAGLFTGFIAVILSISYASLIFSGELSPYLGHGIALAITSIVIVGLIHTFCSGSAYLVVQVDDDTAPVMVLFVGFLLASLPVGLSAEQTLTNVLFAIVISTFIAGLMLFVFGYFKLGSVLQFLPYSAIGGYFAAVGWLLLVGTIGSLVPFQLDGMASVIDLFDNSSTLAKWFPAVLIGIWLRWMSNKLSIGKLLALTIIVSTTLFYLVAFALGCDLDSLESSGFLIGQLANSPDDLFTPITSFSWSDIKVNALLDNLASIATISLIALLSFTLCISAVSLSTRAELDPNKELQVSGIANMLGATLGGLFALPSVSTTELSYELNPVPKKLIGLASVAAALLTFYLGLDLLAYLPKMVLGGLLVYVSLGFLVEWLIKGYRKFGALEYSVIPIILIVSVFSGFLESILFGIVAAIILFAINYSQIKVIKDQASGSDLSSNLVRHPEQAAYLKQHGEKIRLFKLQGFLFFGTAGSLYTEVMNAFDKPGEQTLKYVVLDFSQVLGIDSSATLNFERLAQRLKERQVLFVITGLKQGLLEKLTRGGFDLAANKNESKSENQTGNHTLIECLDVDQGLELCENRILDNSQHTPVKAKGVLELIVGLSDIEIDSLKYYLVRCKVQQGDLITSIGEDSNEVFLLESCSASAYILDSDNTERRIDGAGQGAIYGEIGFFLNIPRTATVRADSDGELYSLNRSSLKNMELDDPRLAAAVNRYMLKIVTERLANTTRSLRTVL
jgi:SulP family sulfate permease